MFSSEIHEHRKKHQKGNNFSSSLQFFVLLLYVTTFFLYLFLLDRCFPLRFMNIVKRIGLFQHVFNFNYNSMYYEQQL